MSAVGASTVSLHVAGELVSKWVRRDTNAGTALWKKWLCNATSNYININGIVSSHLNLILKYRYTF